MHKQQVEDWKIVHKVALDMKCGKRKKKEREREREREKENADKPIGKDRKRLQSPVPVV